MTDVSQPDAARRDLLVLAGAAFMPGVLRAAVPEVSPHSYFATLRRHAGLTPLSAHVREGLARATGPVSGAALQQWSSAAAQTIRAVVGDQWDTLGHTVPSLVEEDLLTGRTREVLGLHLTATEVALLLTE